MIIFYLLSLEFIYCLGVDISFNLNSQCVLRLGGGGVSNSLKIFCFHYSLIYLTIYFFVNNVFTTLSIFSGVAGNNDNGKKKVLLLKGKEREIINVRFWFCLHSSTLFISCKDFKKIDQEPLIKHMMTKMLIW